MAEMGEKAPFVKVREDRRGPISCALSGSFVSPMKAKSREAKRTAAPA
jgi:hypothetical protein